MDLVFGAGRLDRQVEGVEQLLSAYRQDTGSEYLDYEANTPLEMLVPEDLAMTVLINSRFGMDAFRSLLNRSRQIDLRELPDVPLEKTTDNQRAQVAEFIGAVAQWSGFATSLATKVIHKKRPGLVPILDNQAIFGAYMNRNWPARPSLMDSVKSPTRIKEALDWIAHDLTRTENSEVWPALHQLEPSRSRIQLFDSIWWMYFRLIEPSGRKVPKKAPVRARDDPPTTPPATATLAADGAIVFATDEGGYLAWLEAHPSGYVLNSFRSPKPSYLKLHRASCGRIRGTPPRGKTWTHPYLKVCADGRAAIEAWAMSTTSGTVSPCKWCAG